MRKRVGRLLGKGVRLRPGTRKKWKGMLRAWSWEGKWGQEGRDGVGELMAFNWQRPLSPPKGERCRIKSTTG